MMKNDPNENVINVRIVSETTIFRVDGVVVVEKLVVRMC